MIQRIQILVHVYDFELRCFGINVIDSTEKLESATGVLLTNIDFKPFIHEYSRCAWMIESMYV